MKYYVEFRIPAETAARYLPPDAGRLIGDTASTRIVEVEPDDRLYRRIGELERQELARGEVFFTFWQAHRVYEAVELSAAELLRWVIEAAFEPTGEGGADQGLEGRGRSPRVKYGSAGVIPSDRVIMKLRGSQSNRQNRHAAPRIHIGCVTASDVAARRWPASGPRGDRLRAEVAGRLGVERQPTVRRHRRAR